MKKEFETPIVTVIKLEAQDVLSAGSGEPEEEGDKAFWSPYI